MKSYVICLTCLFIRVSVSAQIDMDSLLSLVEANNKSLKALNELIDASSLEFRTGLTPADPIVEYGYYFGDNTAIGDQVEFSVTQSFDFPTVYSDRNKVSESRINELNYRLLSKRQDVLLEAQLTYFNIIYSNKMNAYYLERKKSVEKNISDFQSRLDLGEGNILDLNKAKMRLIELDDLLNESSYAIKKLHQHLAELNGGVYIQITDSSYPTIPELTSFEELEQEYKSMDPVKKSLEQEILTAGYRLDLSKSMWLPKLQLSYQYQGLLGDTYQGFQAGISLPLWENKSTVRAQESYLEFAELNLDAHTSERYFEIKVLYERYLSLMVTLRQYQAILDNTNNTTLLDKALELKQITVIEYFLEMSYFDTATMKYLDAEIKFIALVCELNKYKL